MARNRMHGGLVALSASAVAAIYLTGYVRTQSADASIGAASAAESGAVAASPTPLPAAPTPVPAPPARRVAPPTTQSSPPTSTPAPTTPTTAAQGQYGQYKDGTYQGQGSSRRGDVWVNVTVQSGRITAVDIARSTLQYPLRDIASLPQEVVQRQSAQVDIVSRATYSSMAFRLAVAQALSKAA